MLTLLTPILGVTLAAAVALLGVAALGVALDRRLERTAEQRWTAWHPGVTRTRAPGRHRLTAATPPYRDWASLATERLGTPPARSLPVVIAGLDTWDADTERITLYPVG